MIAGATECPLSPYALACQLRSRAAERHAPIRSGRTGRSTRAASGYVPAEGGAVFVVEEREHALARGARIYGEVTGWAATHDAVHTGPDTAGDPRPYARAMRLALERAGVAPPTRWTWSSPTRSGCPATTAARRRRCGAVFGDRPPPVSTHKSLIGRAHQGGSALDVATALLALRHDTLPASAGPDRPGSRLRAGLPACPAAAPPAGWRWSAPAGSTGSTARWCCAGRPRHPGAPRTDHPPAPSDPPLPHPASARFVVPGASRSFAVLSCLG